MICQFSRLVAIPNRWQSVKKSILLNQNFRRNMHLLLNKTLVNGEWISAKSNAELTVINPANGSIVGQVPDLDANDVEQAIDGAHKAFHSEEWSSLTAKERSALLKVSVLLFEVDSNDNIIAYHIFSILEMVFTFGKQSK